MADTAGMQDIRGLNIDKTVKGFADSMFVFKQLCSVESSSSWQERFFREDSAVLTNAGNPIEGVPRLSVFPHVEASWTQVDAYHKKHGAEERISHEDVLSNSINTIARVLFKVAQAVTSSVDAEIWDVITANRDGTTTNNVTIAAGDEWDSNTEANRDPIQDILNAKKLIYEDNYNPDSNGYLCLNPKDYANLLGNANIRNAGQFYTSDVTRNGKVGFLLGLQVLVSNNVTADYAAVVVGKLAATWKQLDALQTKTIEDAGIGVTIRSWEIGVAQLVNPNAVCLITNTAK